MKPRYQENLQSKIPTETKNGNFTVKVIAGESLGAKAVIKYNNSYHVFVFLS